MSADAPPLDVKVEPTKRGEKCTFRIQFKSTDDVIFDLEYKLVEESVVLDQMLKLSNQGSCNRTADPMHECSHECVQHQLSLAIPYTAEDFELCLPVLRLSQMNDVDAMVDQKKLVMAYHVADYLDMPSLRRFVVERISSDLKDKKPSTVCNLYGVKTDFTEPEIKQMKAEGTWIYNYTPKLSPLETETQDES